jgi:hypothetical protein
LRLWLDGVPQVITEDLKFGEEIDRRLQSPAPRTSVLIRKESALA